MHFTIPRVLRHFIDDLNVETDTDKFHVIWNFRQRPVIKSRPSAQPAAFRIESEPGHKYQFQPVDPEFRKVGPGLGQPPGIDLKIEPGVDDPAKFQRSILPVQPRQADSHAIRHQAGQPAPKIRLFR